MAAALPAALFGVAGLVGSLLGKKSAPAAPAPPLAATPAVMPTPDDQAVLMAKRRSIATQLQRRGRDSTVLTQQTAQAGTKLGG